jgi:hypothetical protein
MAEHPLKGAFKFDDPGLDEIKLVKLDKDNVILAIQNNIQVKANLNLTKQEALKLAAQLMCAFDYDED